MSPPDATEEESSAPGPQVTLHTDDTGSVDQVVLGETTIVEDVGASAEVDLTEAMYNAGFELTTRPLESFLIEVDPEDLDDDDPMKQMYDGEPGDGQ